MKISADTGLPVGKTGEDADDGGAFIKDFEPDPETGDLVAVMRLRGTGIFQDPNDLSMVLAVGALLALYWLLDGDSGVLRLGALAPLALFLFALALTQSRGGMLCLMAGVATALYARYGWRKTVWLSVLGLPPLLILFAGRMTTLSATEGTGQSRIQIWSDGLLMFREHPFFGVGMDEFGKHASLVAHTSFLHAYSELGMFGGTLFLGVFFFAFVALFRIGRLEDGEAAALPPAMRRTQPFLMGVVAAYAVAMLALSRGFTVPTYLILGLVAAYANICTEPEAAPVVRVEVRLVRQLAFLSVLFVAGLYVFVRVFNRGA
jgi:O-antigen ligase